MPDWLVVSIVASVVLTVVLNAALRIFPGAGHKLNEMATAERRANPRVIFPWRTMLFVSLLLTLAVNILLRIL